MPKIGVHRGVQGEQEEDKLHRGQGGMEQTEESSIFGFQGEEEEEKGSEHTK